jgi:hypothetical protein
VVDSLIRSLVSHRRHGCLYRVAWRTTTGAVARHRAAMRGSRGLYGHPRLRRSIRQSLRSAFGISSHSREIGGHLLDLFRGALIGDSGGRVRRIL